MKKHPVFDERTQFAITSPIGVPQRHLLFYQQKKASKITKLSPPKNSIFILYVQPFYYPKDKISELDNLLERMAQRMRKTSVFTDKIFHMKGNYVALLIFEYLCSGINSGLSFIRPCIGQYKNSTDESVEQNPHILMAKKIFEIFDEVWEELQQMKLSRIEIPVKVLQLRYKLKPGDKWKVFKEYSLPDNSVNKQKTFKALSY